MKHTLSFKYDPETVALLDDLGDRLAGQAQPRPARQATTLFQIRVRLEERELLEDLAEKLALRAGRVCSMAEALRLGLRYLREDLDAGQPIPDPPRWHGRVSRASVARAAMASLAGRLGLEPGAKT